MMSLLLSFGMVATVVGFSGIPVTVYAPASMPEAWDNHFSAFGDQDLAKIMLDYTEDSVVQLYNVNDQSSLQSYHGLDEIEGMFAYFFSVLTDLTTLAAPVVDVADDMVFLVWEMPGMGMMEMTDTFHFNADHTISRQNIAGNWGSEESRRRVLSESDYTPANTAAAWDNHFSAFGAQNVDQIMLDYDENSHVRLFNFDDGSLVEFKGTTAIRELFTGLFTTLSDLSSLAAPVLEQTDGMVFLVWECPDMGIVWATDTFIFNDNHKITYQNIAGHMNAA